MLERIARFFRDWMGLTERQDEVLARSAESTSAPNLNPRLPKCEDCGSQQFYEGPAGGMCINIQCALCGSEYNWVGAPVFQILHRNDASRRDMPTKGMLASS